MELSRNAKACPSSLIVGKLATGYNVWGSQSSDSVTPAPSLAGGSTNLPVWETWTAGGQAEQDTGLEPSELTQIPAPGEPGVLSARGSASVSVCAVQLVTASRLTGE